MAPIKTILCGLAMLALRTSAQTDNIGGEASASGFTAQTASAPQTSPLEAAASSTQTLTPRMKYPPLYQYHHD